MVLVERSHMLTNKIFKMFSVSGMSLLALLAPSTTVALKDNRLLESTRSIEHKVSHGYMSMA